MSLRTGNTNGAMRGMNLNTDAEILKDEFSQIFITDHGSNLHYHRRDKLCDEGMEVVPYDQMIKSKDESNNNSDKQLQSLNDIIDTKL